MGLKTEQPSLSVNALIAVARERGVERPLAPSTVDRLLSREGLLDKHPGEPVAIDRRRFAFRYAGELWMSDVMLVFDSRKIELIGSQLVIGHKKSLGTTYQCSTRFNTGCSGTRVSPSLPT